MSSYYKNNQTSKDKSTHPQLNTSTNINFNDMNKLISAQNNFIHQHDLLNDATQHQNLMQQQNPQPMLTRNLLLYSLLIEPFS